MSPEAGTYPPPPPPPAQGVRTTYVPTPRHGLHVAAILFGIFGAVFGLVPLLGIVAFPAGIAAIVLGFMAWRAGRPVGVKQGRAGMALGVVALVMGGIGVAIVGSAVDELDEDLTCLDRAETIAEIEACEDE
jgi:hypothetical protein